MSAISLRLPASLHEKAREVARQESVSVNQLITLALAKKLSALSAEDYLVMRARRVSARNSRRPWRKCRMLSQRKMIGCRSTRALAAHL